VNGSEVTYARRSHNNDSMAIFMAIIKEYSITKLKFCHHLLILGLFQTYMTFFLLKNLKILEKLFFNESQSSPK